LAQELEGLRNQELARHVSRCVIHNKTPFEENRILRMPFEITVGRDPNCDVDKSLHLPSIDTEAVISRAAAAATLNRELARTGTLPACRTELP
jgi:hypothetical protein